MTPRRYLSTSSQGLTVDNRDHGDYAESQQDEIRALREALRKAQDEIRRLRAELEKRESNEKN